MLVEKKSVRQIEDEGYRRWFSDRDFDLIVWYDQDEIIGFQLCYDKTYEERAITWNKKGGFSHNKIDDGEAPFSYKMTPVLVQDGAFNKNAIAARFKRAAERVDKSIFTFVYNKLSEYQP